ncbi:TetR/AcrR family transcriptional regulator [uncultured Psychroserpens sp.]|uniref:TetR/AcrR family transcriptional regulator n=1 Tax=uncultured Psychroserpens sp. TaxID=255436 RepID=UPI0026229AEF|nr:TetR/AcrR family transcriptional regulator [uncultured Psychroserpens sp.]
MDKKQQLITVATQLFVERGFENTPVSLICDTAKVSKGLVFHHFKSKDGLLRAIFEETTKKVADISSIDNINEDPYQQLRNIINSLFVQLEVDKTLFQLNLHLILQPKTRRLLNDLIGQRSSYILNHVKHIYGLIDPENATIRSYMFIAELDGIALNYLTIFEDYPLQEIQQQLIAKYTK